MNNGFEKYVELSPDDLEKVTGGTGGSAGAGSVVTLQYLINVLKVYPGIPTLKSWIKQSKTFAREQCDLLVPPYIQQSHRQFTVEEIRQAAWPYWVKAINSVL